MMKKCVQIFPLLPLFMLSPLQSAVLPASTPSQDASPTSAPHAERPLPTEGISVPPHVGALPSPVPSGPSQDHASLKDAKDLKPEQLQAIAKSFEKQLNSQSNAGAGTVTSQAGESGQMGMGPGGAKVIDRRQGPPPPPSIEQLKRDQAFNLLMDEILPLSPEQIMKLHKFYDMTLQAKATPANTSPTPNVTSKHVHLEPGSETPVIRLAAGFVTAINFVDDSGAPWPLTAYDLGDPDSFNIQWDQKGHTIFVQSKRPYAHGNLAIRLHNLDIPVMLTLVSGQRNVDFRIDMHIPGRGPRAVPVVVETAFDRNAKVNALLINMLDGVPPRGSIKLGVFGGHGDAWLYDNKIYFRTKLTVLSPAWLSTVASPDGTHVYELMITPHILASQNGRSIDIKLSGL